MKSFWAEFLFAFSILCRILRTASSDGKALHGRLGLGPGLDAKQAAQL